MGRHKKRRSVKTELVTDVKGKDVRCSKCGHKWFATKMLPVKCPRCSYRLAVMEKDIGLAYFRGELV